MDRDAIQEQVAQFQRAYLSDPDFVDRRYGVPTIAELVARPDVVGVARYIEFPSFEPERLFTLVYRPDTLDVSAVVGASSLWCSVPTAGYPENGTGKYGIAHGEPFEPTRASQHSASLPLPTDQCPPPLRSWETVRAAAAQAGNCTTLTHDGIVYRHRVAARGFDTVANWYNPDPLEHPAQVALIRAYETLLRTLALYTG